MDLDLDVLGRKLNAVLDTPNEHPISRHASPTPSLASTSSEALQYHQAVYREPISEEERARRKEASDRASTITFGDAAARAAREKQELERYDARKRLGMRGWGASNGFEEETSKLTALRKAEDSSRSISAGAFTPAWTQSDQLALECQRQQEDYRKFANVSSIFLTGTEDFDDDDDEILRYRLRNLTSLLRVYDSLWQESQNRLQEPTDKKQQSAEGVAENMVDARELAVGGTQRNEPAADRSSGSVHSTKFPEAAGKGRTTPRRQSKIAVNSAKPSLVAKTAKKRQKKQPYVPEVGEVSSVIPPTNPSTRVLRQRPERKVAKAAKVAAGTGNSAKPQGVSKAKQARNTRRKSKKD
ncbi:hypothetical protein GLAREA_04158 [Glarea lozoyensis ATCC 20868]|uniref:Uncharacterized protein n=2 Tax=Glarea lozoyensis TaxID=101852 RepID=S3DGM8_GLAL2|nr:uncharacterized protein GLAREA_04158 [Glarea lozoyensis ATCC 20868]EHL02870.1 hypothetical protein M7I_0832 [Glarea lozoyensis 74030]EPE31191.1 hypothetical protein GLAREA_04158 [Glarea lozoyensis ATCC 20868]